MLGQLSNMFSGDKDKRQEQAEHLFRCYSIDTGKKYGEGGYGATYPALDNETKEPLAVKVIDTRRMKLESIVRECEFLTSLDHPNVIKIKAHGLGRKSTGQDHLYYIFMELAGGGELFDQVIDRGAKAMPEEVARGFMLQLLAGVMHCHERGVAHRDLKLENVLLTKEGVVKVIDFGLSHRYPLREDGSVDTHQLLKDVCGSKSYAAPEVLNGQGYNGFAADVWSLGVSLFAMLSGFFPLDEASGKDWRFAKLRSAQSQNRSTTATVYSWYKRQVSHLSRDVVELMDGMLAIDPARRLTLDQVLRHPWMLPKQHEVEALKLSRHDLLSDEPMLSDQGVYDARSLVDVEDEGPVYRKVGATGPAVEAVDVDFFDEESMPVYRSLGGDGGGGECLPLPALQRQKAFGP